MRRIWTVHRIHDQRTAEAYSRALSYLPEHLRAVVEACGLVIGADPCFIGLHGYTDTTGGKSYGSVAHVAYDYNLTPSTPASDRRTHLVLPSLRPRPVSPKTIIHEIGHVLHPVADWITVAPVTSYARENHYEAFAEGFASWVYLDEDYPKIPECDRRIYEALWYGC